LDLKKAALPLPLAIFFVLAIFYTFYSVDVVVSRDFLFFLISYILIFFLVVQISSPNEARWIAFAIVSLGILTSLYGLYQYCWAFKGLISTIRTTDAVPTSLAPLTDEILGRLEARRIFSTFLLPSHFAAFLGMSIPVSMAFIMTRKDWLRYLWGIALGVQIFALYLTKSFSGWLSLILASGCFAFIYLGYVKRVRARYLAASFVACSFCSP
jgi:hypothetical protein